MTKQACCPIRTNPSERSMSSTSHGDIMKAPHTNYDIINSIPWLFKEKSLQVCYFTHKNNIQHIFWKHASFSRISLSLESSLNSEQWLPKREGGAIKRPCVKARGEALEELWLPRTLGRNRSKGQGEHWGVRKTNGTFSSVLRMRGPAERKRKCHSTPPTPPFPKHAC